jgi:hypothetical protein
MIKIFEEGYFENNRVTDSRLNEVKNATKRMYNSYGRITLKTTIFLSHKHSDLNNLKGIIGFLENAYDVNVYIDSRDPNMPENTSGETAKRIKSIIEKSDKFILLATNDAIESKWCNWELGFGDAKKYDKHIAIFPMKKKGSSDNQYKGNEYLYIYPHIVYFSNNDTFKNGNYIKAGYYVCKQDSNDDLTIETLQNWLMKR